MSDQTTWSEEHKHTKHKRFLELLGKDLVSHHEYTFELKDKALVDFRWFQCSLPFWPTSNKHIIKLGRMFVPDAFRGKGYGAEMLAIIKDVAEKANIIVLLRVNGFFWREREPFSLFGDGHPSRIKFPVYFENVKDVFPYWYHQVPETNDHYYTGWERNIGLREWYLFQGFSFLYDGGSVCLNTDHRFPHRSDVMVYVPSRLKIPEEVKRRIHNR
jgi:GNAT superfamily N-acetyltransferase